MAAKLAATLVIVVAVTLPDVHTRKIPSYVKVCKKSEPDFDACVINSVETLRPRLHKGIPKINVPPIEPFLLPQLEINRDLEAIKMRAFLQNVVAYGGSGFVINRLKINVDKLALELSVTFPHIDVTADYDVDGRVLVAPIKSKGVFKGNFTDVQVDAAADGKVATKNGVEYIQVNRIKTKIRVGDSNVKVGVDNNDRLLHESALQFYNQNKKQILNIIMPIAQETAEEVITQIGNRILSSFPLSELLPA